MMSGRLLSGWFPLGSRFVKQKRYCVSSPRRYFHWVRGKESQIRSRHALVHAPDIGDLIPAIPIRSRFPTDLEFSRVCLSNLLIVLS